MIFIPDFCPLHFAVASLRCKYSHFLGASKRFAEKSSFCNVHFIKTRRFIVWRPRTFCRFPEDESWQMSDCPPQRAVVCLVFGEWVAARCFSGRGARGDGRRQPAAVRGGSGEGFLTRGRTYALPLFFIFSFTASPSMRKHTDAQTVRGEGFTGNSFTHAFTTAVGDYDAVAPAFRHFAGGFSWFSSPGCVRVEPSLGGRLQPEGGCGADASPR